MSLLSIIILVIIGGIVWGGFLYFLIKAIKMEKRKNVSR